MPADPGLAVMGGSDGKRCLANSTHELYLNVTSPCLPCTVYAWCHAHAMLLHSFVGLLLPCRCLRVLLDHEGELLAAAGVRGCALAAQGMRDMGGHADPASWAVLGRVASALGVKVGDASEGTTQDIKQQHSQLLIALQLAADMKKL